MEHEIDEEKRMELGTRFRVMLEKKYQKQLAKAVDRTSDIEIDFCEMDKFSPKLGELLLDNPKEFFSIAEKAIQDSIGLPESKMKAKFFNIPNEIKISNIRSKHSGKFIAIEGIVRKASDVRPEIMKKTFRCSKCDMTFEIIPIGLAKEMRCAECGRAMKEIAQEKLDARWITIEEPFELTEGEKPAQLNCIVSGELSNELNRKMSDVGNRLKMSGIVKEIPKEKMTTRLEFYFDVNFVATTEDSWSNLEVTKEDEIEIKRMASNDNIYTILSESIAPSIYGLDAIKEAVLLQIFGGVHKNTEDGGHIRGDIHILILGEPATSKSTLMKIITKSIPRAKYVSGTGSSKAGLTATVTKDDKFMGGWVLEAGALVLCNGSLLMVDEFEKMMIEDQVIFHESMENGEISISKATITATLPARTSILAGANPSMSRFDPFLPIVKQVSIPETLLSRFDLKFILKDKPNKEKDTKLLKHIQNVRRNGNSIPKVSNIILKKYISYTKAKCVPEMTDESEEKLQEFYLTMREISETSNVMAITLRQFEALCRLAEASAKVQLSPIVRIKDAERAIRLMEASLIELGYDPKTKNIDIDRVEGNVPQSERGKTIVILDMITKLSKIKKDIGRDDLVKALENEGVNWDYEIENVIDKLCTQGLLFKPSPRIYQRV
jgi:replicative DNA helicase Mcm